MEFIFPTNDSKIFLIALTPSKGYHLILIPVINFSRYNGNINPPKKNMLSILLLSLRSRLDSETRYFSILRPKSSS